MMKMGYESIAKGFSFLYLTTVISIIFAAASYKILECGLSEKIKSLLLNKNKQLINCIL